MTLILCTLRSLRTMMLYCLLSWPALVLAVTDIPIVHHISRAADGSQPLVSTTDIQLAMAKLNAAYLPSGLQFYTHEIRFIDRDDWHQGWDSSVDWLTLNDYTVSNALNVFHLNSVSGNGRANFPYRQRDYVFVRASRLQYTTLIHEIGHYFGLLHTYSSSRQGPDCVTSGDLICDTPFDPGGSRNFNSQCDWIGDDSLLPDGIHPDGRNYLSDASSPCRTHFSEQQLERIARVALNSRFYLGQNIGGSYQPEFQLVRSFPHHEDFEPVPGHQFSWLDDVIGDDYNWWHDPVVPTFSTGPQQGGAEGSSHFLYTDRDNEEGGRTLLLSPLYDFRFSEEASIRFHYFMFGRSGTGRVGSLALEIRDVDTEYWTELWSVAGKQHDAEDDWTAQLLQLPAEWQGKLVQFRFVATQGSSSRGIIALDNIQVDARELEAAELRKRNACRNPKVAARLFFCR